MWAPRSQPDEAAGALIVGPTRLYDFHLNLAVPFLGKLAVSE